ncbi:cytochrome c oxidase assembly protein [Streptacidiphilus sp. 4-A2]|nr:cytochrome c oxidase assembly protein [Streptacidiphilus sp. 4-A2]
MQSVVLLMVVPLLLAMGAPVTVLLEAAPERFRSGIRAALQGRGPGADVPAVSTVVLIIPPWLLYFTAWYRLSLTTDLWNIVFHVAFVLFGLAYYWPRLQLDPVGRHYHPLLGVVITVAEVIFDAALGFILVFGSHMLVPDYWASLHRPWGMSPRTDQSWGGAVLWGLGDIAGVPFLVALIIRVVREDRIETAKVDRRLDEEAAARTAAQSTEAVAVPEADRPRSPAAPAPQDEDNMRPWWLDDPNLAHRFGGGEA